MMQRVWLLGIWLVAAMAVAQPAVELSDALAELGPPAEILVLSETGVIVAVGGIDDETGFWLELEPGASGRAIMIVSRPDGSALRHFDVALEGGRVLTATGEDLAAALRARGVAAVRIAERSDDAGPPAELPGGGGPPSPGVPPVGPPGEGAGGDAGRGVEPPVSPPAGPGGTDGDPEGGGDDVAPPVAPPAPPDASAVQAPAGP